MAQLKDKVIVITGGTTGIGAAAAKVISESGAKVIATGRNKETLEAAKKNFGNTVFGNTVEVVQSDAADPRAIADLFAHVKEKYQKLDGLYLNAGIAPPTPLEGLDPDHFEKVMNVNVRGPLLAIKQAIPLFSDRGSIVITSSIVNQSGMPGFAVYGASKAAVRSIVRTAAAELAPKGVRVNAVSPGPIETPLFGKMGLPKEEVEAFAKNIVTRVPLGRLGQSVEIANAAAFLLSDEASYITGEELVVDGGMAGV